ncbi:MAG: cobalamin B12-binding domain-containing protein [Pedosphaera sp.]|nr:cobalamin B12-binding domain-containing protein [Pedosphaera sp.]
MVDVVYPIKIAAKRSGLSSHVIRIWERRYRAVQPGRTGTNRRRYSEADVERLRLLNQAVQAGHSIGSVAQHATETLRDLVSRDRDPAPPASGSPMAAASEVGEGHFVARCLEAIRALDSAALEGGLREGALALGSQGLLHRVIGPLAHRLGDLWRAGDLTAAHEHFATAVLRTHLRHEGRAYGTLAGAPTILVTTPVGQIHELGALLVAAASANLGWNVIYLGPSLPAAEIAGAALQGRVRAVALSLVYPEDDAGLLREILRLRGLLAPEIALFLGGRALPAYRGALNLRGIALLDDLPALGLALEELRNRPLGPG